MAQVIVRENESLESALKRFKRSCARDGVMSELRKREHYEKPSVARKKKSEAKAVFPERLNGILRAGRTKTALAAAQKRRNCRAVHSDKENSGFRRNFLKLHAPNQRPSQLPASRRS